MPSIERVIVCCPTIEMTFELRFFFFYLDGCDVYTNLATDPTLFEGQGDLQFDIYREMRTVNGYDFKL